MPPDEGKFFQASVASGRRSRRTVAIQRCFWTPIASADSYTVMIDVTAAILTRDDGRILIARKKPGTRNAGLWEFVGGKVEAGETPEVCLRRELKEELGIESEVGPFLAENIHHYPDFSIRLLAYLCRPLTHDITLRDHDEFAWVEKDKIAKYDLAPADIPIIKRLADSGR